MIRSLVLCLLLSTPAAWAAEREIVTLEDPAGDDHGNGTLVYPQRTGFTPGDLDLISLKIFRGDADYRFEATFRNPVRDPAKVAGDAGPEPLSYFARRGFYAFNLDVYIDQDRVPGSGKTYTLPGRGARIDPSHAWEKAIILTPRPELMRKQLVDAVAHDESADFDAVAQRIDASILFPTQVQVRGRTLAFTVPAAFLASAQADDDWSITAFVTGAQTSTKAQLDLFSGNAGAVERLELGVMQPRPGRPRDSFGYSGTTVPGPIVDLLAPAPADQKVLLAAEALVGVSWTAAGERIAEGRAEPSTALTTAAPAPARPAPPGAAAPPPADIAERLRRLEGLRAEKLISEEEYRALRQKILSEL